MKLEKAYWNGCAWYENTKDGYWRNRQGKLMHRVVWASVHGEIPHGAQIHHVNESRSDNRIENLACLTVTEHQHQHLPRGWVGLDTENRSANSIEYWRRREPVARTCKQCGASFMSTGMRSCFCGPNCQATFRRRSGVDNETRSCVVCGGPFTINRYKPTVSCSLACKSRIHLPAREH